MKNNYNIFLSIFIIILIISCLTNEKTATSKNQLDDLIKEAEQIDKMDNVPSRKYYNVYMMLGDKYFEIKDYNSALNNYKKGLQLNSWDFKYQLKTAQLEYKLKFYNDSYNRAQFILSRSDDLDIISETKSLLKKYEFNNIKKEFVSIQNMFDYNLYLVNIGEVDDFILQAIANRISEDFKINVEIIKKDILPDKKNIRNNHNKYFDDIINNLKSNYNSYYNELLFSLNIKELKENDYALKEKIVYTLYLQEEDGQELWEKNMSKIKDQYNTDTILDQIEDNFRSIIKQKNTIGFLGIINEDIYSDDTNFVFGSAGLKYGIMSYIRFFDEDTTNTIGIKRTLMQAFSSVGHIIGIPRCTSPTCARAYPNSLEEHDRKEDKLCNECLKNLEIQYNTIRNKK